MITLEDAMNRNYYFYSGTGEVRTDFVRQVFEIFLGYDYSSFIQNKANMLIKNGMYRSDAYEKARHMAVETALRACEAIPKYRREIIKKFEEQPGLRGGISDVTIINMKYNDLSTLRTNLGLNKRGKKVKKVETAPKKTVEQAKKVLKEEKISKTVTKVIESNEQLSLEDYNPTAFRGETEEFYTVEEARKAYPGYSYEELLNEGIHLLEEDAKTKLEIYALIDEIKEYDLTIGGETLTEDDLLGCSINELNNILNVVKKLNRMTRRHTK